MRDTTTVSLRFQRLIRAMVWLSVTIVALNLVQVAVSSIAIHFGLTL